ncbi:MAG: DUF6378 domain-containing protein [Rhodospirillaceae bacterium]
MLNQPPELTRTGVLRRADELICKDRADDYGDAHANFTRIARMWSAYLGREIAAHDVANMMALLKISRLANQPTHYDSAVDLAGYAALGAELAERELAMVKNSYPPVNPL